MNRAAKRLCLAAPSAPGCSRPFLLPVAGLGSGFGLGPVSVPRRSYAFASGGGGAQAFQVFNRRTKWLQKERAASNPEASRQADYLKDEVANRLCERLLVRKRTETLPAHPGHQAQLPRVLDLGANSCNIARALTRENPDQDPAMPITPPLSTRIDELVAAESSHALLHRDADLPFNADINVTRQVLVDEEHIPFPRPPSTSY
ncbi:methyltransferase [Colletotrichum higginsianum]|nr:methyltransferase [Colletotrichum higginsianum]